MTPADVQELRREVDRRWQRFGLVRDSGASAEAVAAARAEVGEAHVRAELAELSLSGGV